MISRKIRHHQTTAAKQSSGLTSWLHGVLYAVLLLHSSFMPTAFAGPQGGQVTGGAGSISQSGNTTTINQSSQNMSINWNSYNVNVDERVQYIQPNSQSISLNRILSNHGSTMTGLSNVHVNDET